MDAEEAYKISLGHKYENFKEKEKFIEKIIDNINLSIEKAAINHKMTLIYFLDSCWFIDNIGKINTNFTDKNFINNYFFSLIPPDPIIDYYNKKGFICFFHNHYDEKCRDELYCNKSYHKVLLLNWKIPLINKKEKKDEEKLQNLWKKRKNVFYAPDRTIINKFLIF